MSRMLEEIRQQPDTLERTLAAELRPIERFKQRVAKHPPRLIVLAARGTSDNAALFGRYLLEVTTGIPVSLPMDFAGVMLPEGAGYPIGAYASPIGSGTSGNASRASGSSRNSADWSVRPRRCMTRPDAGRRKPGAVPGR